MKLQGLVQVLHFPPNFLETGLVGMQFSIHTESRVGILFSRVLSRCLNCWQRSFSFILSEYMSSFKQHVVHILVFYKVERKIHTVQYGKLKFLFYNNARPSLLQTFSSHIIYAMLLLYGCSFLGGKSAWSYPCFCVCNRMLYYQLFDR